MTKIRGSLLSDFSKNTGEYNPLIIIIIIIIITV